MKGDARGDELDDALGDAPGDAQGEDTAEAPAPAKQISLFGEILDWMLAPLLLLWPMSVALTWLVAQGISNRPYDRELGALVTALAQEVTSVLDEHGARQSSVGPRLARTAALLLRTEDDDQLQYQILGQQGELLAGEATLPAPLEPLAADGRAYFRDDLLGEDTVRLAAVRVRLGPRGQETQATVQIAETLKRREQLATEIIKGVILPQFVILPLAVLLVWFALTRAIRPLHRLQQRIRHREANDLSPIPVRQVPEEVAPLVDAINDLLQRLDTSMAAQRQFLADAAHQLKTPLAGLRMQAELAEREIDRGEGSPDAMRHSLQQIALSSERAAHMVNQLLSMARAEDAGSQPTVERMDLAAITMEVVREFVPRALAKSIDLGYEGPEAGDPARIMGMPVLAREIVRNLVDNALQYTPSQGAVTARVRRDPAGGALLLEVEDNGPGVPLAERDRIFQPFYRALGTQVDGSGLGLAIVREIAGRHGASVSVREANAEPPPRGPGALFTVRFPLPADD